MRSITDALPRPLPPVSLPAAGGYYVDPVFGIRIIRVTDPAWGTHCAHAYSTWPALNADCTLLLIACDSVPTLVHFDPWTGIPGPKGPPINTGTPIQPEGAQWDRDDRALLYALEAKKGTRLVAFRAEGTRSTVKDFGPWIPGLHPWGLGMSEGATAFSFSLKDNAGVVRQVAVWDRTRDEIHIAPPLAGAQIHGAQIDKAGSVVKIAYADGSNAFWRWGENSILSSDLVHIPLQDAQAIVGGHWDMGYSLYAGGDVQATGSVVRRPDGLRSPRNILHYTTPTGAPNWAIVDHCSLRAVDESSVLLSTYGGDGTYANAFENELLSVATDGSGFRRLAHTRSVGRQTDPSWNYYSQPRAVISGDGRWVVFTSDLGDVNRHDVMILEMPR